MSNNAPPANTFSGWIASLFGGNTSPSTATKGVATYSGTTIAKSDGPAFAAVSTAAVPTVTAAAAKVNAATVKRLSSALATLNRQIPKASGSALTSEEARYKKYSAEIVKYGGKAPAMAKPATVSKVTTPATHTTVANAATVKPATTTAGTAGSTSAGIGSSAEVAVIAGGVFLVFVLVARRKKR